MKLNNLKKEWGYLLQYLYLDKHKQALKKIKE
jgi:hypothetical protein